MTTHPKTLVATLLALATLGANPALADSHHHHRYRHRHVERYGQPVPAGPSQAYRYRTPDGGFETPNGGFRINRYGNGNYTRGADGGFGGYPAGSAGAEELMNNQRYKCKAVPESC